ncbi:ACP S-malonyltransferase [Gilvimarinus sp. F26214L]|uniref:ACP S-malonyltransferase n=1 Tax=Gilvimarinus sp. DZF01 TaxID=3461371 RepID=UPI0040459D76
MRAFVFPGQGSQSKGMGKELFDQVPEFREAEARIDEVLGYSIRELCLDDPRDELNLTQFTQPALFVVNALYFFKRKGEGEQADYLAGHSLGEYNALLAAGAFDLVTGVELVRKRGALMGQAKDGGMAAVIGLSAEQINKVLSDNDDLSGIDVANYNSPAQTVISGPLPELEAAQPGFKEAGAKLYKVLPVSAAFHSRYMQAAADEFAEFLKGYQFKALERPVIANVTGEPYPTESADAAIKELLVRQISGSVQWTQSIRYLKGLGEMDFEELGPGKVLTKLIKQID